MSHQPRKRFGQNFLQDAHTLRKIVSAIHPQPTDHIVEIGPGQAAMTRPLLASGAHLDVIELDRDLIAPLKELQQNYPMLGVHNHDALKFDLATLAREHKPFRLVGNLPYNISTPLLFHCIQYRQHLVDMHFMLQREVVQRMAATAGGENYGRLSVMLQLYCRVQPLFNISNEAFYPKPKVESSFVRLTPHTTPPVSVVSDNDFAIIVRDAFAQRRKTLRNSLRPHLSDTQIADASIEPGERPENLDLAAFARLSNALSATKNGKS
jgi:16S rRNA (adenine1518-N6/adenine1519-N6)-dimethyltransferase